MPAPAFSRTLLASELFSVLFGGHTEVKEVTGPQQNSSVAAIGYYHDQLDKLRCIMMCDFEFANSAGAALSLVPPAVVQLAVRKRIVDENLIDNLREVLNICTNLFPNAEEDLLRLDRLEISSSSPIPHRLIHEYSIQIPKYPEGRIRLAEICQ